MWHKKSKDDGWKEFKWLSNKIIFEGEFVNTRVNDKGVHNNLDQWIIAEKEVDRIGMRERSMGNK